MKQVQTAGIAVITVLTLVASAFAAEHTKDSLKVVKENVDAKKAVLVDVREKSEWDKGHIEGAVFLPLSELQAGVEPKSLAEKLPKGKVYYTHCVVGKRSVTAGNILEKRGYDVRPLKAGYEELLQAEFKKATK